MFNYTTVEALKKELSELCAKTQEFDYSQQKDFQEYDRIKQRINDIEFLLTLCY